jgi:hypothetical protein
MPETARHYPCHTCLLRVSSDTPHTTPRNGPHHTTPRNGNGVMQVLGPDLSSRFRFMEHGSRMMLCLQSFASLALALAIYKVLPRPNPTLKP